MSTRGSTVTVADFEDLLGPSYRVPRVDLLPPEVLARRRFRSSQRIIAGSLAGLVVVLGGGYAVSAHATSVAGEELAAEQARTTVLQAEQARYAEVPLVYAQVDAAQAALTTAMATDVRWYSYLDQLAATYPQGAWLTSLTASVDPAAAPATGGALATPGVGSITFGGSSLGHPQVADWLDALDTVPGFADPAISTSDRTAVDEQPVVTFESSVTVTPDVLSHRFEQETR